MRKTLLARPADRDETEINLTPMLDVVFILLIFFIVTATFVRESGIETSRADGRPDTTDRAEVILVRIDATNEISIDGHVVDHRALRAHLARLRAVNADWPVVIEPNGASTTRALVAALDAARLNRIDDVSIAGAR